MPMPIPLALQNRRLDEARRYVEQALEFAPEQASILDTLGYDQLFAK